jgi:hypothetical protein
MTEQFDAVLAEGRKLWNQANYSKQQRVDELLDRLAAAHEREVMNIWKQSHGMIAGLLKQFDAHLSGAANG